MMRWLVLASALLTAFTLYGCNGGEETPGIFGQVISKGTRQPIADATISLRQNGNEIASVQTNDNGKFAFIGLEPGTYTLVVSAEGYWDVQHRLMLAQGQRLSVTIEMISLREGPPTDVPIVEPPTDVPITD